MKKILRILEITFWILLTGGLFVALGFTNIEHNSQVCKDYEISIDYGNADVLITRDDIYQVVKQTGHILKGQRFGLINAERIESAIRRQPYVAKANVFVTIDGHTQINVIQRQPILRIFNQKGESYYLDGTGHLLPLNPDFSARVPVANGHIPESYSKNINYLQDTVRNRDSIVYGSVMNNLFILATYIIREPFLKALVDEIYVDNSGDFELVTKIGSQLIIFGKPENMEEKFKKLLVFYRQGLNKTGWNKYNVINIKYRNQVVCSKI